MCSRGLGFRRAGQSVYSAVDVLVSEGFVAAAVPDAGLCASGTRGVALGGGAFSGVLDADGFAHRGGARAEGVARAAGMCGSAPGVAGIDRAGAGADGKGVVGSAVGA